MPEKNNTGQVKIDFSSPVLVVEDNEGFSNLVKNKLLQVGLLSKNVLNGAQAIDYVMQNPETLMLLDHSLPDMTGKEVLETLLERLGRVYFIIMTGYGDENLAVEMMKLGASDYLVKDEHFLDLLPTVAKKVVWQITTEKKLAEAQKALIQSEKRLRAITNSTLDAIIMVDSYDKVSYWNPAAEKIFGFSSDEIFGRELATFIVPEKNRRAHKHGLLGFQKGGQGHFINSLIELSGLKKNGDEFPIELSLSSVKINDCWHAIGIIRDITSRKQMEEQFRHTAKLASIGELAGGVAHEVRTCLGGMMNHADRVNADIINKNQVGQKMQDIMQKLSEHMEMSNCDKIHALNDDLKLLYQKANFYEDRIIKNVKGIFGMGKRGSIITNDLLSFSKRHPPQMKPRKIDTVISSTLGIIRGELEKSNIEITTEYEPDLPPVNIDEDQINQVIMNLVLNARNAMNGRGTIKIRVGLNPIKKNMEIYILDTGCGIPEDKMSRIFDPFFTTTDQGTGLGLSVSYGIIQNHKGEISVESRVGKGSTFKIHLPLE